MQTIGNILFPVDFSDRCLAARPFVTAWARRFNAKVRLLHTVYIPMETYGNPDGFPSIADVPGIEAAAKRRLDRFEMEASERVAISGDPAFEIIEYAGKHSVDLIMMPTHGYGPFRSLLLGSVAAKVLHDAHCAVWTSAHTEDVAAHSDIHNVLCAIDGSASVPLIRSAGEIADKFAAKVHLFHAENSVPSAVREAALAESADLVIISSGKAHKTLGQLRSKAYTIIRDSPCPVLSLP